MHKDRRRRLESKARYARRQALGRSKPHVLCGDNKWRSSLEAAHWLRIKWENA